MLTRLMTQPMIPTLISRERGTRGFHLDQLPNATSVLFEEPCTDNTSMGEWILLLEGTPTNTDMKHQDKEIIEGLSISIPTNQELWSWCESKCLKLTDIPKKHRQNPITTDRHHTVSSNEDSSTERPPSGVGQTGEGPQDGYGYDMYQTIPTNHFKRTQFVVHGTLPISYWWGANFSSDQRPICIPYRICHPIAALMIGFSRYIPGCVGPGRWLQGFQMVRLSSYRKEQEPGTKLSITSMTKVAATQI
ncbi:hypothetical protein PR048_027446 [Dryococelus australis]|uniref:Uncharacterized protein n=1 Tax=Dryococelus australis TaxID=614101 RepID=A0ABQ9GGP0_9NEOP|nr:hypothetical protein PR048_027446 [Dryococelus australis]